MDKLLRWWDGGELWVAEQSFLPQVVVVLAVVLPLAWWIAGAMDRVVFTSQIPDRKLIKPAHLPLPKSRVTWALAALLVLVLLGWLTH